MNANRTSVAIALIKALAPITRIGGTSVTPDRYAQYLMIRRVIGHGHE